MKALSAPSLPVCNHVSPSGRHCRQAVFSPKSDFCSLHSRASRSTPAPASPLAARLTEVHSSSDITGFLVGVLKLLAQNRIPARRAAVLTYIANSVRQSLRDEQREAASDDSPVHIDFGDLAKPQYHPEPAPVTPEK